MSNESELLRAAMFAAQKHTRQRRKDKARSPYINHPLTVASILANEAGVTDLATLQTALLHDTVEDTPTSFTELTTVFGNEVAALVAEMTDDKNLPSSQRKALQIEHASELSPKAALVKIADKIANLRDIALNQPRGWTRERCRRYFDWAQAVVQGIPCDNQILLDLFTAIIQKKP